MNDVMPDSTAARGALRRALHLELDAPPHVLEDEIGLRLLAPDKDWRSRADMDPQFTHPFRASIVALAREAGFKEARHVCADDLARRYFANRTDGLRPPAGGEELLVAST